MNTVAPARAYTLIYDGNCGVCGRIAAGLGNWDRGGRLEILPSQAPGVHERFPWIDPPAFAESMQLVRASDGKTWQGAAAIEQLLGVLPRGRWIAWIFEVAFVRWIADRLYRWFAHNRYHLGCSEHCRTHPEHGSE